MYCPTVIKLPLPKCAGAKLVCLLVTQRLVGDYTLGLTKIARMIDEAAPHPAIIVTVHKCTITRPQMRLSVQRRSQYRHHQVNKHPHH